MSLRDELQELHDRAGKVTPRLVVEHAREAPGSELHRYLFGDFDDERAADVGRLYRARKLLARYRVVDNRAPAGDGGERDVRERVRLFSAIPSPGGGFEHHPTEQIVEDPQTRVLLLRQAEREWKALKARYGHLREFVDMVLGDLGEEAA